MRLLTNVDNEIIGYSVIGGIDGDFEVSDEIVPNDFIQNYKSKYYLYQNEQIVVNPNYQTETLIEPKKPTTTITTSNGSDDSLRKMFASMQVQLVQANTIVAQMTQQNAKLSQEVVELKDEIESMKGENKDEDAVSEV